jgi:hypothetical protein
LDGLSLAWNPKRAGNLSGRKHLDKTQPDAEPSEAATQPIGGAGPRLKDFRIALRARVVEVIPLWLQYDFDAAVLLVAEHLVHFRSFFEPRRVGDDEGRVDLAFLDAKQ